MCDGDQADADSRQIVIDVFAISPLDLNTCTILEYYTEHPPATVDGWYGPWNTILTNFFPSYRGYIVTPQRRAPHEVDGQSSDFIMAVVKLSTRPTVTFRTVLILEIKNTQHWESGIPTLQRQLGLQTDSAFAGTAHTKVYWIGAIGPHWMYGEKEVNDQNTRPLSEWHHTIHDQASFEDLQSLVRLVSAL
jgi:hypothetical protein